jgi:hypothetical protein
MATTCFSNILIPYQKLDAENGFILRNWIVQQLSVRNFKYDLAGVTGVAQVLTDRDQILCRVSTNNDSLDWNDSIQSIDCFLNLTRKLHIFKTSVLKVAGLPDGHVSGESFVGLFDSYTQDQPSPRKHRRLDHSCLTSLQRNWKKPRRTHFGFI